MKYITTISWTWILLIFFATSVVGEEHFDRRSTLLQSGEVATMEELLAKVRTDFPGHILEVELENEGDGTSWVYEVKILHDNGSVAEIDYDAKSLTILDVEQGGDWRRWYDEDD